MANSLSSAIISDVVSGLRQCVLKQFRRKDTYFLSRPLIEFLDTFHSALIFISPSLEKNPSE